MCCLNVFRGNSEFFDVCDHGHRQSRILRHSVASGWTFNDNAKTHDREIWFYFNVGMTIHSYMGQREFAVVVLLCNCLRAKNHEQDRHSGSGELLHVTFLYRPNAKHN